MSPCGARLSFAALALSAAGCGLPEYRFHPVDGAAGETAIDARGPDGGPDAGDERPSILPDAARDAGADAGSDVRTDVRTDVTTDATTDVRTDATTDATTDARNDGGADVSPDVRTDAGADTGTLCGPTMAPCNGQCVNLSSDPLNCGSCGTNCNQLPNVASGTCMAGACSVETCNPFTGDCNGIADDGCESSLQTDVMNCGTCSHACTPTADGGTASCNVGTCMTSCPSGTHVCSGACVSDTSVMACGTSCTRCPTITVPNGTIACLSGQCGVSCDPGFYWNGAPTSGCTTPEDCTQVATSVPVRVGATLVTFPGNVSGATASDATGSCDGAGSPDKVVQLDLDTAAGGHLTVTITPAGFNAAAYIRTACNTATSELGCVTSTVRQPVTLTIPITTSQTTVYLWIESIQGGGGSFTATARITP